MFFKIYRKHYMQYYHRILSHTEDMLLRFYLKVNDLETDTEKRKRKVVKETTIDVTERYF